MNKITLGSLFDGAGGFPYAGTLADITPVWASEIEPFPIRVTTKRFPDMKHLGNIMSVNGAEIEPVDVITFGSPCQDLSVAGKRAGLAGERSGLFLEAIRIIREMRDATHGKYPKYIVWENVPGAFSSNKGEDFRIVLEQIAKIKEPDISIPKPDSKWLKAGEIVGDSFSIAWRTLDAQFWGVPQRRRRIYLVADFNGQCAGKIQFESDRLCWDSQESKTSWQGTAGTAENNTGTSGNEIVCLNDQGGIRMDVSKNITGTLMAGTRGHPPVVIKRVYENHSQDSRYRDLGDVSETVTAKYGTGGNNQPIVVELKPYSIGNGQVDEWHYIARWLTPLECCRLQGFPDWWCEGLSTENPTNEEIDWRTEIFETHRKAVKPDAKPKSRNQIIKWLKNPRSDSAEYKMWGNSLAIPCAYHVLAGIAEQYLNKQDETKNKYKVTNDLQVTV